MNELEKFEKYFEYYNLCDEGRKTLREAAKKICADENMLAEALRIKNKLAGISNDDGLGHAFGHIDITKENIKDAPTDTLLRKKLVEHILSGGVMKQGGGFHLLKEGKYVK